MYDKLNNEENLKKWVDLRNEDDLKNQDKLKNEDDLMVTSLHMADEVWKCFNSKVFGCYCQILLN